MFSVKDWLALIPPTLVIGGISYYSYYSYQVIKKVQNGMAPINPSIRKDQAKVVDVIDIEDINGKQAFCRCWKSAIVSIFLLVSDKMYKKRVKSPQLCSSIVFFHTTTIFLLPASFKSLVSTIH